MCLLLMAMVATAILSGAGEGGCPRPRYVDNVEWLGSGDLGMDMSMPGKTVPATGGVEMADPAKNDSANSTREETVEAEKAVVDIDPPEEDATGSGGGELIRLILAGDVMGRVEVDLLRAGEVVFGAGELTARGSKMRVGVSGSASEEALILKLVPEVGSRLYLLDLKTEAGSIRGGYEAFDSSGRVLTGRAERSFFA
ncbi:hypothetical protein P0O15_10185 [Methanotrichaceae archaeon Mx]|uniref:Uncharacterized protein n=2 Tax=Candidatus Methanocrinis natronophilus TaxID=3033396 RepID=A0ABT5X9Z2_9EURY|nr:hypothetical protein [Candidatus Methanocrinis natronophilus]